MLGFLYIIGSAFVVFIAREIFYLNNINDAKEMKKESVKKYNSREDMTGTYVLQSKDGVIETRDIITDKLVTIKKNEKGDRCVYSIDNRRTGKQSFLRNIDEEERQGRLEKNKESAIKNNQTVAFYMKSYEYDRMMNNKNKNILVDCYAKGDIYKDIISGEEYVIRAVFTIKENIEPDKYGMYYKSDFDLNKVTYFYMDVNNGKLIRRTDGQKEIDLKYGDDYNSIYVNDTDSFINEYNNYINENYNQSNNIQRSLKYNNIYSSELDIYTNNVRTNNKYILTGTHKDCYYLNENIINKEV